MLTLSPSIMSTETSMLLLWLVLIQEGAAIRPVVTFSPNYKKIFTTESITMTCDGGSTIGGGVTYTWYTGKNQISRYGKSIRIEDAETSESGNYRCETRPGEISDPATLDVSNGYVILQTPLYVYEGDEINIRCRHNRKYAGGQTIFYKDDRVIRDWADSAEYYTGNVNRTTAGKYECKKKVQVYSWFSTYEDEASVSVEELFTTPTITVTPQPVFKKQNMTQKCETDLNPYRQDTQLRFAFYREGWIVQGFSINDTYESYNVQLEDSGKYSCEVKTTDGRIRKRSAEHLLQIEELFSHPNITVTKNVITEGDLMSLTCNTTLHPYINGADVLFAFYRNKRKVREFNMSDKYEVQSTQQKDSGNYTCEVKSDTSDTMKTSYGYNILVKELFSPPLLKVSPELVNEGDNMTLTCETNLTEHRPDTTLQYAFYRDGRNVQGFSPSNKFEVQFMQMDNSGTYTCEIQTPDGSVTKTSQKLPLPRSDNFLITILYISLGLLLFIAIIFIFLYVHYQRRSSHNNVQPTTDDHNEYSTEAEVNYTVLELTSRPQSHVSKDNGSSVVYATVKSEANGNVKDSQGMSDTSTEIYQNIGSYR